MRCAHAIAIKGVAVEILGGPPHTAHGSRNWPQSMRSPQHGKTSISSASSLGCSTARARPSHSGRESWRLPSPGAPLGSAPAAGRRRTRRAPSRDQAPGTRMPSVSAWRTAWISASTRYCVAARAALTSSKRRLLSNSSTRHSSAALHAAASAIVLPSHMKCGTPRSSVSSLVRCASNQRSCGTRVGISAHKSSPIGCARTLVSPARNAATPSVDVNHLRRRIGPQGQHQRGELGPTRLLLPGTTRCDPPPNLAFRPDYRP